MPRKQAPEENAMPARGASNGAGSSRRRTLRLAAWIACSVLVLATSAVVWSRTEQFLVSDPRLILPPSEPGASNANFQVSGLRHATLRQVEDVFARDFGRSIYLCPIQERRRQMLGVDWILEASVSRVWPNRLVVQVTEREPVAFVQIASPNGSMRVGLIDSEGVLLDAQKAGKFNLPVLSGINASDAEGARKDKVRALIRLRTDLGPSMDKISEVDVSDLDNLKMTGVFDKHTLVLLVGNQMFRKRFEAFLNNYDQIRQKMPGVSVLDLRLPDRITAVSGSSRGV